VVWPPGHTHARSCCKQNFNINTHYFFFSRTSSSSQRSLLLTLTLGLRRPRREADIASSWAETKNGRSCTAARHTVSLAITDCAFTSRWRPCVTKLWCQRKLWWNNSTLYVNWLRASSCEEGQDWGGCATWIIRLHLLRRVRRVAKSDC
jgi:hypothetical protein